jgi:hypothetical protein
MSSELTPEEARKMYLASLAYFTNGEHLKPKESTPEPTTTIYPYAVDKLKDGTLTWKDYIASLNPEELTALRKREREKAKKWYQENKQRKKQYDKEYYAQKRGIVLYDEDL